MSPRIFLLEDVFDKDIVSIKGDNARYISTVLRCNTGEPLTLLDNRGNSYSAVIVKSLPSEVVVRLTGKDEDIKTELPIDITLAQAIPKGDKMDIIIQKATELGVKRIIPIVTERTEVRITRRLNRWKEIAISAAQQSRRLRIPEIESPVGFNSFMAEASSGIIFWEKSENSLKKVIRDYKPGGSITIVIGPEGGFSDEEIKAASERGFQHVSLGPRISRAETAAIVAVSIIQYELGDLQEDN